MIVVRDIFQLQFGKAREAINRGNIVRGWGRKDGTYLKSLNQAKRSRRKTHRGPLSRQLPEVHKRRHV